jgi:hypothetical protein
MKPKVVIAFQSSWLDTNGFMVGALDFGKEYAIRNPEMLPCILHGTRLVYVNSSAASKPSERREELYPFQIHLSVGGLVQIRQQLTNDKKLAMCSDSVHGPNAKVYYESWGDSDTLITGLQESSWRPFITNNGTQVWLCVGERRWRKEYPELHYTPASAAEQRRLIGLWITEKWFPANRLEAVDSSEHASKHLVYAGLPLDLTTKLFQMTRKLTQKGELNEITYAEWQREYVQILCQYYGLWDGEGKTLQKYRLAEKLDLLRGVVFKRYPVRLHSNDDAIEKFLQVEVYQTLKSLDVSLTELNNVVDMTIESFSASTDALDYSNYGSFMALVDSIRKKRS